MKKKANDYLIIALDTSSLDEAVKIVDDLGDRVSYFKIGLELFSACGPSIIKVIKGKGKKVFFDGKFLDIPNTVAHAIYNIASLEVDMLDVHLTGGETMLQNTKDILIGLSKEKHINKPQLIGITVLTSIDDNVINNELGIKLSASEYAIDRAMFAFKNGLDGIVCSPNEARKIRKMTNDSFTIITPGIRPEWAEKNDQKRFTTPKESILNGVSFIVVGRPITAAQNRKDAALKVLLEIEEACSILESKALS